MFVDCNQKGNVAELAIAKEAAALGLTVLKPMTEHERYDLVFEIADRLIRVQCKWGALRSDLVVVRISSSRHSPTRGYIKTTYSASEVDVIAVYCGELDSHFLLPVDQFVGQSVVTLRLRETKNNQRAALNWAADYEFRGAIAQLEERLTGSQKVVGSSPTSSTQEDCAQSEIEEVGAHIFRNHFGHYLERAAGGQEILIRRRGKPYASLCPVSRPDR
jgi:prevent-host-death family protein